MTKNQDIIVFAQKQLLHWHQFENPREHPWTKEKDPYKIWLSEIIMQQTQVAQGLPYYLRFVAAYPTVHSLAIAKDEVVFLMWQGLGYYNRCRNLLYTARFIDRELKGVFPRKFNDILALKGIGSYTAAAICSFAYGLPYAVLDGNVFRVLSRFFAIDEPIDDSSAKKRFQKVADSLLPSDKSAAYNQAIMDFGAVVCKPKEPLCEKCPLLSECQAKKEGIVSLLPFKKKKLVIKQRYFHYFLLQYQGEIYMQQRMQKDIWQHLFELYLIESKDVSNQPDWEKMQPFIINQQMAVFENKQRLTHQLILSTFHILQLKEKPEFLNNSGIWMPIGQMKNYAFPKTVLNFIDFYIPKTSFSLP